MSWQLWILCAIGALLVAFYAWTGHRYGWVEPRTPQDRVLWHRWKGVQTIGVGFMWLFAFPGGPTSIPAWITCAFFVVYGAVRLLRAARAPMAGDSRREKAVLLVVVLLIGAASTVYFLFDDPPIPPRPVKPAP